VTLRRFKSLRARPRKDPVTPDVRDEVLARDNWTCVLKTIGYPHECYGRLELDHVRKGGMGLRSRSTADNLVSLCNFAHRIKTENGRAIRPLLLAYLAQFEKRVA
jgi:5-methylcytosine-specific restriction endonuclease McrA